MVGTINPSFTKRVNTGLLCICEKGSDEQCLLLNVSGSAQSIVNGQYLLDKSFGLHCSSHPVWTKTASSTDLGRGFNRVYIYYQDDGFDGWIIS